MSVSVIIPTFNRAGTIVAAVESVLSQTFPVELIVVDDGSMDGTTEVLRRFGSGISVIVQENAGPSAARNRGVKESSGEVIAFLDSDDSWLPDKISRQLAILEKGGDRMCCCICNATINGKNGEPEGTSFGMGMAGLAFPFTEGEWTNPGEVLATRFLLFNQVVAVRRTAFDKVGGFNAKLRILEDFEFAMRLSTLGSWGVISDPLVVKNNDTVGIGVACGEDGLIHTENCISVIESILERGHGLNMKTLVELRRSRDFLGSLLDSERRIQGNNHLETWRGHSAFWMARALRAIRRRSPFWPQPEMNAL